MYQVIELIQKNKHMIDLKQLNAEAELLKYESDVRNRKSGNPCSIEDLVKIFRENSLGGL